MENTMSDDVVHAMAEKIIRSTESLRKTLRDLEIDVSNKKIVLAQEVQEKTSISEILGSTNVKMLELNYHHAQEEQSLSEMGVRDDELCRLSEERQMMLMADVANFEYEAAKRAEIFKQGPLLYNTMNVSRQIAELREEKDSKERKLMEDNQFLDELFAQLNMNYVIILDKADGSVEETCPASVRNFIHIQLDGVAQSEKEEADLADEKQKLEVDIMKKIQQVELLKTKQQCQSLR